MKILCIGEEWRGSDASGLFNAFSRIGHVISVVNHLRFVTYSSPGWASKVANRCIRSIQVMDFNKHLMRISKSFNPDLVLIYKGMAVKPETVHYFKSLGLPVINFYPDVSFTVHGEVFNSMPLFDHIFTTKSFGAKDLNNILGLDVSKVSFIPHGFDPTIHRPIGGSNTPEFQCDVSFIGNYSLHKFNFLLGYREKVGNVNLKIWEALG